VDLDRPSVNVCGAVPSEHLVIGVDSKPAGWLFEGPQLPCLAVLLAMGDDVLRGDALRTRISGKRIRGSTADHD
jgi:hypothetical protein